MIVSFRDRAAEQIWQGNSVRRLPQAMQPIARRKLRMLNNAQNVTDLRVPPGNRLEALRGDQVGQHSIRINDQWRVCFVWRDGNAHNVEITDYH